MAHETNKQINKQTEYNEDDDDNDDGIHLPVPEQL